MDAVQHGEPLRHRLSQLGFVRLVEAQHFGFGQGGPHAPAGPDAAPPAFAGEGDRLVIMEHGADVDFRLGTAGRWFFPRFFPQPLPPLVWWAAGSGLRVGDGP